MAEQFANDAFTTLAEDLDASETGVDVASAVGAGLTALPASAQFRVRVDNEIMLVTGGAGSTTWTVTRGAEGTTSATHANGATVYHLLTAGGLAQGIADSATTLVALAPAASARNTIQPTGAAVVPLTLKGAASQTGSLQEWQDSAGTPLALVASGGRIDNQGFRALGQQVASTGAGTEVIYAGSQGYLTAYDRGGSTYQPINVSGSRVDLRTGGTVRATLDAAGQWQLPTTGATGGLLIGGDTNLYRSAADVLQTDDIFIAGISLGVVNSPSGISYTRLSAPSNATAPIVQVDGGAAAAIKLVVKGTAAQTGNLFEAQSSAAAILASISAAGDLGLAGFAEMIEITAPATPAANKARLFLRDTGGKTELCAKFESGNIVAIATDF